MAEQQAGGSFGLDGGEATKELLAAIVASTQQLSDNIEQAGVRNDAYLKTLTSIDSIQDNMATSMSQYSIILNSMLTTLSSVDQLERARLTRMQEMTTQKNQQVKADREGQDIEEQKNRTLKERWADSKAGDDKATKSIAGDISQAITNPLGAITSKLGTLAGPAGIAAMVGMSVGAELGGVVTDMRAIARNAGMGAGEAIGMGNMAAIESERRFASMSIPLLKESYASDAEMQQGLGTMVGQGGIRGDALAEVFEGLPKKAYEAGMKFSDVAAIMGESNRVLAQTPREMKESFDMIVKSAKEGGHAVAQYVNTVSKLTFELAAYGANQHKVNAIVKEHMVLVEERQITEGELAAAITMGLRARMSEAEISDMLKKAADGATVSLTRTSEQLKTQEQILSAILPVMEDTKDGQIFAAAAAKHHGAALTDGSFQLEVLTGSAKALISTFGMTTDGILDLTDYVNKFAKSKGINPQDAMKDIMEMSNNLLKITREPLTSIATSKAVYTAFADDIKDLSITAADLSDMMTIQTEKFDMSAGAIVANTKYFKDLGEVVGVSTSQIKTWAMGFAESSREMFNGPKEAMANANRMVGAFAEQLANGKMTQGDYDKVMRNQMDVMGSSSHEAFSKFDNLVDIVDKTNVRMSELASWTEQLSKVNKQYGYETTASTALLSAFSDQIRSGAMSLKDLESVMKGSAGGSDGYKALTADTFRKDKDSEIGKMMNDGDMLGNIRILLPELQRYAGSAEGKDEKSQVLIDAFKDTKYEGMDPEKLKGMLREELNKAEKGTFETLMGGDTSLTKGNLAKFQELGSDITGSDLKGSYGIGLENLYNLKKGDGLTLTGDNAKRFGAKEGETKTFDSLADFRTALKNLKPEEDLTQKQLISAYDKFGGDVRKFGTYIGDFRKAQQEIKKAEEKQALMKNVMSAGATFMANPENYQANLPDKKIQTENAYEDMVRVAVAKQLRDKGIENADTSKVIPKLLEAARAGKTGDVLTEYTNNMQGMPVANRSGTATHLDEAAILDKIKTNMTQYMGADKDYNLREQALSIALKLDGVEKLGNDPELIKSLVDSIVPFLERQYKRKSKDAMTKH